MIDKLTHEMAVLKRLKFAAKSEAFNAEQKSLLEETIDADLAALAGRARARSCPTPQDQGDKQQAQAPAAAGEPAAPRDPPRAREHHLQLRLRAEAHRRGRGREARLRARRVHAWSATSAASGSAPSARRWCRRRCRRTSSTRASPRPGCWPRCWWPSSLDHLPLYRQERIFERAGLAIARSTLAQWVGECGVQLQPLVDALRGRAAQARRAARRRDAGGDAQAGQRQDAPGLPVELLHDELQPDQGGGVRLRRQPRRPACPRLPRAARRRRLAGHAGLRRLQRLQGLLRDGRDRGRLPGARAAQVPRAVGQPPEPGRRAGAEVLRDSCTRSSARCANSTPTSARRIRQEQIASRSPMRLHQWLIAAAPEGAGRLGHGQGDRLQPESLGGADALHRRRRPADRQQLGREPDPADCDRAHRTGCSPAACAPASAPRRS